MTTPVEPFTFEKLQALLESMTVTLVVHPEDEERIRAAVAQLEQAPPIRVVTSPAMQPGRMATWSGDLLGDMAAPVALSVVSEEPARVVSKRVED